MKNQWKDICNKYLRAFCERHEFSYEDAYWSGDEPGTTACVSDYFFSMDDIRYDVDNEVPDDMILEWYDYVLDVHEIESKYREMFNTKTFSYINYESWCKGAPKPYSEKDFVEMHGFIELFEKGKQELAKYEPFHERYKSVKLVDTPAFPYMRQMAVEDSCLFPKQKSNSVRSSASILKKDFGAVFMVKKDGNYIFVQRLS